jgi:hypothetical protein
MWSVPLRGKLRLGPPWVTVAAPPALGRFCPWLSEHCYWMPSAISSILRFKLWSRPRTISNDHKLKYWNFGDPCAGIKKENLSSYWSTQKRRRNLLKIQPLPKVLRVQAIMIRSKQLRNIYICYIRAYSVSGVGMAPPEKSFSFLGLRFSQQKYFRQTDKSEPGRLLETRPSSSAMRQALLTGDVVPRRSMLRVIVGCASVLVIVGLVIVSQRRSVVLEEKTPIGFWERPIQGTQSSMSPGSEYVWYLADQLHNMISLHFLSAAKRFWGSYPVSEDPWLKAGKGSYGLWAEDYLSRHGLSSVPFVRQNDALVRYTWNNLRGINRRWQAVCYGRRKPWPCKQRRWAWWEKPKEWVAAGIDNLDIKNAHTHMIRRTHLHRHAHTPLA